MIYTDTAAERLADIAVDSRPSLIRSWVRAAFLHLVKATSKAPSARDRARDAADLRIWATYVRQTNPRFAEDLFAAADRHEAMAS